MALRGRRAFSKTSDTWTCPSSTGVCPSWPLQVNKANGRHFLARAAVNGSQMSCTGPIQCSACETMNHFRMNSCQRRESMNLLSYFFDSNRCQLKCQCLVSPSAPTLDSYPSRQFQQHATWQLVCRVTSGEVLRLPDHLVFRSRSGRLLGQITWTPSGPGSPWRPLCPALP